MKTVLNCYRLPTLQVVVQIPLQFLQTLDASVDPEAGIAGNRVRLCIQAE
jgi:hypothetical protein